MSRLRIKPKKKKSERITLYEAVRLVMERLNCSEAEAKRQLLEAMGSGQLTAFGTRVGDGKIEPVPQEYWQPKPREQ
jgi:hypothetical protein